MHVCFLLYVYISTCVLKPFMGARDSVPGQTCSHVVSLGLFRCFMTLGTDITPLRPICKV